jgi:hypothetical protein
VRAGGGLASLSAVLLLSSRFSVWLLLVSDATMMIAIKLVFDD